MAGFFSLKVKDIVKETKDSVSIALDVPGDAKSHFEYIQGQYITLKVVKNGEEIRRCYSICSSPASDDELRIAVKKVNGGKLSSYLNEQVKAGDLLEVMPPMGSFYSELKPLNKKNYILFAGGSGITPVISILKTALHVEPSSRVMLFYANRDEQSVIFKGQLKQLSENYQGRLTVYHILEFPQDTDNPNSLFTGIMTVDKTRALMEKFVTLMPANEYFICGPPGMKENVLKTLMLFKIDRLRIHIENFTIDTVYNTDAVDRGEKVRHVAGKDAQAKIIIDGDEYEVKVSSGSVILQAALDAGIDAPFSCRGGMCSTCRAKLIEGKVEMEANYALTDKEVSDGYILTCQSHPLSPTVTVNYDQAR